MKKLYENIRKYMSIEYIKGLSRNAKLALSLVGVLLIVGGASLAFGGSQSVEITESSTEVVEEIETAEIINA
jgi:hypothetical protein